MTDPVKRIRATVVSGEVHILSGSIGAQISGAVIVSGTVTSKISGETITIASGAWIKSGIEIVWRGIQVSGTVAISGSLTASSSGNIVITAKDATRFIIFSGYGTTNTLIYSGFGFTKGEKALIGLTCLTQGSGIQYTIRGDILSGIFSYSMTSGSFTSGQVIVETITDPYEWIDIGIASLQTNFSGTVMVGVVVK